MSVFVFFPYNSWPPEGKGRGEGEGEDEEALTFFPDRKPPTFENTSSLITPVPPKAERASRRLQLVLSAVDTSGGCCL